MTVEYEGPVFSLRFYSSPQRWAVENWNGAVIATVDNAQDACGLFSDLTFYTEHGGKSIADVLDESVYSPLRGKRLAV